MHLGRYTPKLAFGNSDLTQLRIRVHYQVFSIAFTYVVYNQCAYAEDEMTDTPRVFSLHYHGIRFTNNRIPVEVLPDLPAFRELLLSYAKDEWRSRHPERKKLPKNFDKELSLSLFEITDGSAVPKLEWLRSDPQTDMFDPRDDIDESIEAAYNDVIDLFGGNQAETPSLDAEKLRALNRLGAGLREQEKIDFTARDGSGKVVSLDMHRRKQLITQGRDTYQSRLEGTGELVGTYSPSDTNAQCSIQVQTIEHGTISIPIDRLQLYEEFADALNTEVQFELLVELDSSDKFKNVVDVYDVVSVEDVSGQVSKAKERLEELGHLSDGWQDGQGKAIGRLALNRALDFLVATRATNVDFAIFPTERGGILIDFSSLGWEYSIEFDLDGNSEMYGIEVEGRLEMQPTPYHSVEALLEEFLLKLADNG